MANFDDSQNQQSRHLSQLEHSTNTYKQIADLAVATERIFASAKITINPASQLAKLISSVKHLADAWEAKTTDTLPKETLTDLCNAFRIFQAVEKLENQPNIYIHLSRLLKGSLDFSTHCPSSAKDFLFEIETFFVFHQKAFKPLFLEPDINIDVKGNRISVACKKIYSNKRLQDSLSKAVAQINRSGKQGIAAINIDDLLPENSFLRSDNIKSAQDALNDVNIKFIQKHEHHIRKYLESSRILACVVSTSAVVFLPNTTPSLNNLTQQTLWTVPGISLERQKLLDNMYDQFSSSSKPAAT